VYRTRLPIILALEKKVGDKWVVALGGKRWLGPEELESINPGTMRQGTWRIAPTRLKEVPGTYRIVLDLYGTEDGEMLPMEERVRLHPACIRSGDMTQLPLTASADP
jgi:hypothetical protein